jgi:hypothetical protein
MSINWDTPISELMHSDTTPLGLIESDEELMHWKYINKEKKNGKWVYTYPDDDYSAVYTKDGKLYTSTGKTKNSYLGNDYREYVQAVEDNKGNITKGRNYLYRRNTSSLFSQTITQVFNGQTNTYRSIGVLERLANKARNWLGRIFS